MNLARPAAIWTLMLALAAAAFVWVGSVPSAAASQPPTGLVLPPPSEFGSGSLHALSASPPAGLRAATGPGRTTPSSTTTTSAGTPTSTSPTSTGTPVALPHTGADLLPETLLGVVIVLAGAALRGARAGVVRRR